MYFESLIFSVLSDLFHDILRCIWAQSRMIKSKKLTLEKIFLNLTEIKFETDFILKFLF